MASWTVDDVGRFVDGVLPGTPCAEILRQQGIDGPALQAISLEQLRTAGNMAMEDAATLYQAIQQYNQQAEHSVSPSPHDAHAPAPPAPALAEEEPAPPVTTSTDTTDAVGTDCTGGGDHPPPPWARADHVRDLERGMVDTMDFVRAKIGKIEEAMDHASPDVVTGMIFTLYCCLCCVFHHIGDHCWFGVPQTCNSNWLNYDSSCVTTRWCTHQPVPTLIKLLLISKSN